LCSKGTEKAFVAIQVGRKRMTAMEDIAKYLVETKFEDIPQKTVEKQKDLLIDTLGVAVAGANARGVREVVEIIREIGGKEEASIIVHGGKYPSFFVAMANSLMAHSLDFDDMHERAGIHANVCVAPAALAIAEKVGCVDGKTLLTAIILGVDLICRMGVSIPLSRGWHATTTFGIFGATVASSKILALNEKEMANALGIAYSQSSGNRQGRLEGTLAKRLQVALAVKSGVLASILAAKGMTGPKKILEGDWGMFNLYADPEFLKDPERVIDLLRKEMGKEFLGDELSVKPYPSCKATHTSIQGILNLLKQERIQKEEIENVEIFVSKGCYQTVGRPFEIRTDPQVDAQFSIPYTVATAILRGNVGLEDFTETTINDSQRIALTKKVKVVVDPSIQDPSTNVVNLESQIVVNAKAKRYSYRSTTAKGDTTTPMNREEILSKFESCLQYGTSFPPERGKKIFSTILNLEKIKDIRSIIKLLC
jgi:2-methylcitrate dehydratase PrpD